MTSERRKLWEQALEEGPRLRKLAVKLLDYIDLLGAELDETAVMADVHGWRSSRVAEGEKLRAEIGEIAAGGAVGEPSALEVENQKLKVDRRGFQIMARKMVIGSLGSWMALMNEGKYDRAGGDVECEACRQTYVEHPELPGFPTFHVICRGEIVKT